MRQKWLELYAETGSVTKTALRCGVARSTLYRWINRGKEEGKSELSDKSKRPSRLANMKITPEIETIILNLRETRRWGTQRIANYLLRKRIKLSAMTVWRVLKKHQVRAVVKRRKKSDYIRYVFRTISVQCSGDTRSLLSGKDRLLATKLILFS